MYCQMSELYPPNPSNYQDQQVQKTDDWLDFSAQNRKKEMGYALLFTIVFFFLVRFKAATVVSTQLIVADRLILSNVDSFYTYKMTLIAYKGVVKLSILI